MNFKLFALSAEYWPFSLEELPQPAYLVGGAVRDALLARKSEYLDLDFVIPNRAVDLARAIARQYQAGFVLLDAQRQIARVVFPQATVDFAQQEGDTLETDLRRRDFTINALAYNPHTKEIIDPLQGSADLKQRLLRMVSPTNLQDDPIRLLRAYRQAAQLDFAIEPETQAVIRSFAPLLGVAAERVRVELGYLLASTKGTQWLQAALEDGLLVTWFPNATEFIQLAAVDSAAATLTQTHPQLGMECQAIREIKTTWLAIAKIATLVNPHPEIAEIQLTNLTYSRAEIKSVTTALKLLPQLQVVPPEEMSLAQQFFYFRSAGAVFPVVVLLAVASGVKVEALAPLINRYLNPHDPVAYPTLLVTGKDLMSALQLKSSPLVGELLLQIQLAQIEGKVCTVEEAIAFASQLLDTR